MKTDEKIIDYEDGDKMFEFRLILPFFLFKKNHPKYSHVGEKITIFDECSS